MGLDYAAPTQIDPAESLLVITGVGLLTGERQADVSADEIQRAINLPETIESKTRSCFNQSLDARGPAPVNFRRSLKKLSKVPDHSDHVDRIGKFPPGYTKLAISYNVLLHQLQGAILQMLPVQAWQSVGGTETGPPSDKKMADFLMILQVIDEPLTVFRLISNGQLTKKQALAVKTIYPTFAETVTTSLVTCWIEHKAKNKDYRPNWILYHGLSSWFEASPIPGDMMARAQAMHIQVQAQAKPLSVPGQEPGPQKSASPSLQAQYGTVR